jgi:PleD family two-component response regulator
VSPSDVPHRRPPLVLIVNDQEWSTRSLESILAPSGYAVLRAYTAGTGLKRAIEARPDVILVGAVLPDMDGLELCRALRDDPRVTPSTPIMVTTTSRPGRNERLAALRAGAWDILGQPLDAEELVLRFDGFVRAKHDADLAREEGLVDRLTGLYSMNGLSRRARELASQAYRQSGALACVVFRIDAAAEDQSAVTTLAERLKAEGRSSDVIGRVGEAEFAVFALGANREGAEALVQRIVRAAGPGHSAIAVGYHAVEDNRTADLQPQDFLAHASAALPRPLRAAVT